MALNVNAKKVFKLNNFYVTFNFFFYCFKKDSYDYDDLPQSYSQFSGSHSISDQHFFDYDYDAKSYATENKIQPNFQYHSLDQY